MRDNEFDDFFRTRLSEHVSEVPADMWQRIRSKDKDRRGIILWWTGLTGSLLLFAALVSGYFLYTSHSPTATQPAPRNSQSPYTPSHPGSSPLSSSQVPTRSRTVLPTGPEQQGYPSPHAGTIDNDAGQSRKIRVHRPSTGPRTETYSEQPSPYRSDVYGPTSSPLTAAQFSIEPGPGSLPDKQKPLPRQIPPSSTAQSIKRQGSFLAKPRQNWFMGVFLSPDMPFIIVRSNDPVLTQQVKNNQKMELSYTAGLQIGRIFGKHFSVTSGIQYSRINAKIPLDSNFFNTPANHYNSLDIPIIAGYALGNGHFSSVVKAGIVVNAYSWYRGAIITDTLGISDINNPGFFRHYTGLSLQFGVDLTKQITPNLQLFAGPFFRYRLSDMTRKDSPLPFTQKINVSGLTLGVRYTLPSHPN